MNKEFKSHKLNERGFTRAVAIANLFDGLLNELTRNNELCPPSRELAIVKTKLEEACFFAKKAMACQPENCVGEPGDAPKDVPPNLGIYGAPRGESRVEPAPVDPVVMERTFGVVPPPAPTPAIATLFDDRAPRSETENPDAP